MGFGFQGVGVSGEGWGRRTPMVSGFEFRVSSSGRRIKGFGVRVCGSAARVQGGAPLASDGREFKAHGLLYHAA